MSALMQQGRTWEHLQECWSMRDVQTVRFETPDLHGIPRSKIVPFSRAAEYVSAGLPMFAATLALDSASHLVPGTIFEESRYGNQLLFPDLSTALVLPWCRSAARILCTPDEGRLGKVHPRNVLAAIARRYASLGFALMLAHEMEFFLLTANDGQPVCDQGHMLNTLKAVQSPVFDDIMTLLPLSDLDVAGAHCEYAPGQFEVTYSPRPPVQCADAGFTLKYAIKEIAHRHGLVATFMTQPFTGLVSSGCHVHVSLNNANGQNALWSASSETGLSASGASFLAGQLKYARALMALMAPTVNCYHRYRHGAMAPRRTDWGVEDRTAAVRVVNAGSKDMRVENRLPSSAANPYLAATAVLAAGLLGIEQGLGLREVPASGDKAAELPGNLEEALEALARERDVGALLDPGSPRFCWAATRVAPDALCSDCEP